MQLMHIPQIRKSFARLYHCVVNVDITVRLLCAADLIHQIVDRSLYLRNGLFFQKVASTFDPFGDIRIEEEVIGDRRHIHFVRVRSMPCQPESVVASGILQCFQLVKQRVSGDSRTSSAEQR